MHININTTLHVYIYVFECVYINHILFIMDKHLGCFHALVVENNAAMLQSLVGCVCF